MIEFTMRHCLTKDALGWIPYLLFEEDPRSAREQFEDRYSHGGGWNPMAGFKMTENSLRYPGDPPMRLLAEARLHNETLRFYEHDWMAIVQPDGSYEVSRMD